MSTNKYQSNDFNANTGDHSFAGHSQNNIKALASMFYPVLESAVQSSTYSIDFE